MVFYTNVTLAWWLLCFDQTCSNTSYSDSHVSVLKPTERDLHLQNTLFSGGLFIRKVRDCQEEAYKTDFPNMPFTRSNEKLKPRCSTGLITLDMPREVGPEMKWRISASQLWKSHFIDPIYKSNPMTAKRSLFLKYNHSLAFSPQSLKERLNTCQAFIHSWLLVELDT